MDYKNLSIATWRELDGTGSNVSGYKSVWLALTEDQPSRLHIFKDNSGKYHFAIELPEKGKTIIEDPAVNGLQIKQDQYRLAGDEPKTFIDLRCNIDGYLNEFTEVVKDIAKSILVDNDIAPNAVVQTVQKWKSFWGTENRQILSEDKQIGLICELNMLERLIQINPANALQSWVGPLDEKQDFIFTAWSFEVKGTRKNGHIHTINGIDQLKPPDNRDLALISYRVRIIDNKYAISLEDAIGNISGEALKNKPDLVVRFNNLLSAAGYSPLYSVEYRKFKIEISDATLFEVDDLFPSLTTEKLIEPLNDRISFVRYDIALDGLKSQSLAAINLGDYFY